MRDGDAGIFTGNYSFDDDDARARASSPFSARVAQLARCNLRNIYILHCTKRYFDTLARRDSIFRIAQRESHAAFIVGASLCRCDARHASLLLLFVENSRLLLHCQSFLLYSMYTRDIPKSRILFHRVRKSIFLAPTHILDLLVRATSLRRSSRVRRCAPDLPV